MHYIDREGSERYMTSDDYPSELEKKMKVGGNSVPDIGNFDSRIPHLRARIRKTDTVVMHRYSVEKDTCYGNRNIDIFVKLLDGKTIVMKAHANDPIKNIKAEIKSASMIPETNQHLIFCSKILRDDCTISSYQITNHATLHLSISLIGGFDKPSCSYKRDREGDERKEEEKEGKKPNLEDDDDDDSDGDYSKSNRELIEKLKKLKAKLNQKDAQIDDLKKSLNEKYENENEKWIKTYFKEKFGI